jgi:iron complex outermembrane receptor protein
MNMTVADKYLFTGSLRRDGSTRFGPANKWGLFPAFAFGWRILEEDFSSGLTNTFSDLKLRIGWGITGNERIGSYLFSTFYKFGTGDARYQFGDEFVRTLRGVGVDPDIKWEETTSLNIGLDFGFSNGKVNGSIDLYNKSTNDLLFTVAASAFTNLSDRILTNIGEMSNKGVELVLNTVVKDNDKLRWDISFNAAYNKNKIVKLDNSNLPDFLGYEEGGISGDIGQTIQILKVGESSESFRTYRHIYGADGKPLVDGVDWNGDGIIDLSDIYQDQNDDGIVNEKDLVIDKNALPNLILGLSSSVRYKQWDMTASFRAHAGNYVYNNVASSTGFFNRLSERPPVTNNVHKSTFVNGFSDKQLKSDVYIENASFVKLDNITFGYTLNSKSLKELRVYVTASNIFTLTGYSGFDPELPQFTNGVDNNLYPVSRNILLGVNVNF